MRDRLKLIKPHIGYLALGVALLLFDRWTKAWAEQTLSGHHVITIIPGFFDFSLAYNTGAAFGIGRSWPEAIRKLVFHGISSVAAGGIAYLNYSYRQAHWIPRLAVCLMLTGAIGNLIDRFRYGMVVDFIHFFYRTYHYPNFNIADSSICVGITLFALFLLKTKQQEK